MNKKSVLAVIFTAVFMAACAGNKNAILTKEAEGQFVQATPFKTLQEEVNGEVLTGIGTSEKRANFTLMREAAITSAQADLVRKVQSKVEAVWKRTMSDWSEYKKEGFNEAMSVEEMKTLQKSIVDTELRGPWQTQELVDKDSGRYWVRIVYSASTIEKWAKEKLASENILKKYFIESQIKNVQADLEKDLESVRQRENTDKAKISAIVK
ncbi:MAG: hypothetical protein L6420_12360 [Elusimicrobia bacterium]|nr:hypothetical protein [Elusimicrobiota bacterium]